MNDASLQDQIVLIIGAGRPPGPQLARAFAQQGAVVVLNDLSPILLDPIVSDIERRGGRSRSYVAEASRGMPLRAMIDDVLSDWEQIDILINNPRIQPEKPLIEIDEWDWQRAVEMNLNGPFLVSQIAARLMREQGSGMILNIVSDAGEDLEQPGVAAYAASQAGLLALSKAAGREFLAYNIRVYTLCAGKAAMDGAGGEILAQTAVSLCQPGGKSSAGQVIHVDPSSSESISSQE